MLEISYPIAAAAATDADDDDDDDDDGFVRRPTRVSALIWSVTLLNIYWNDKFGSDV
jgi:hypothetical protein